ncbi:MAG TPA: ATP-binding protein [Myxococcota bacterium]|nr:ATP-binding protein [Myxococcota bacterium]HOC99709.1 ATP-binding protein [Myxococcota bacterium]HOH76035.1 ATP-binding protein [Myxococcota bacterium]HPV04148.1 ATP-binding protein [Myxococcota bacterium]
MDELRVLVVDDELGIRMAIAKALRNVVVEVPEFKSSFALVTDSAETAEDAYEMVKQNPPDILLLDQKLPGMSGIELLEKLVAEQVEVLTIMITAYASLETAVAATKSGAFDFLAKPFTPYELRACLFKAAKHIVLQRQAMKLVAERKRVRFEFLSVVAHELKSPTAAVEGYLMMMKDRVMGDTLDDYTDVMDRAIFRLSGMHKLIADLLDLTRIESGSKRRDVVDVDVLRIADLSADSGRELGKRRGITVDVHKDGETTMKADSGEIELIINNFVSNAVKYNRDQGHVDVTVGRTPDGMMRIQVRDTGIGMKPEDVKRLFGEFVRIKNEKTKRIEGSGLGLSIVKKLVDLYQGRIEVHSEWEVGTQFTVFIADADPAIQES